MPILRSMTVQTDRGPMMDTSSKELGTQAVPVPLMDAEHMVTGQITGWCTTLQ